MKAKMVSTALLNFRIFLISMAILFVIAINMGLASHDANTNKFIIVYCVFAIVHLAINIMLLRPLKEKARLLGMAFCEIILLYSLTVYLFIS